MKYRENKNIVRLLVVSGFVLVGSAALLFTQATTQNIILEPEMATITAPAEIINDPTASFDKAIKFAGPESTKAPWGSKPLYVESDNSALTYARNNPSATGAALINRMGQQPVAKWFGGWSGDPYNAANQYVTAAVSAGAMPIMVVYNIPIRDCGSYSAGGAASRAAYNQWIDGLANGINGRATIVILEPDGLGLMSCLNAADKQLRYDMLKRAVQVLAAKGALVYIEASTWVSPADMAAQLNNAGIQNAQGFAINASGYNWISDMINYGIQLSGMVGGKRFVIDTSRNGAGPTSDAQWCNPPGRALGTTPTTKTASPLVDAYLWIKTPWESDGTCNGGPSAGQPNWTYAIGLAQAAGW